MTFQYQFEDLSSVLEYLNICKRHIICNMEKQSWNVGIFTLQL